MLVEGIGNPDTASTIVIMAMVEAFAALENWNKESIFAVLSSLAERMEVKINKVIWPVRIAVAGKAVTPGGPDDICTILGREETLRRLKFAQAKLG